MAELDVQPKRKSPWWIWLLILLIIVVLLYFLRGCSNDKTTAVNTADSTANIKAATQFQIGTV